MNNPTRGHVKIKKPLKDIDKCSECGGTDITTYDSRNYTGYRRRNRKCNECGHRFATVEIMSDEYVALKNLMDSAIKSVTEMEVLAENGY